MNTEMNRSITITEGTAQYDAYAKRLIGHRSILGYVVTTAIGPCRGMNPQEAAELIEGDVLVGTVPVDAGMTNAVDHKGDRVVGLNTESTEIHEGTIYYDLLFYMNLPDELSQVIVNIEIQKSQPSNYALLNRGIYYACRAVSAQKEREFTGQMYDNIKSVYSVWLCMNAAESRLTDYHLTGDCLIGNAQWPGNLDMLHVVMLGITTDRLEMNRKRELHRLLSVLFSHSLTGAERNDILEREYRLMTIQRNVEEVNVMCNLGEGLVEYGYEEATAQHVAKMFSKNCAPEQIAELLDLSLDKVMAILTGQGLIQA